MSDIEEVAEASQEASRGEQRTKAEAKSKNINKDAGVGANRQWNRVKALFRAEYGETVYQRWLSHSRVLILDGERLVLSVADKKSCGHVEKTYGKRLLQLWQGENRAIETIEFVPPTKLAGAVSGEGSPEMATAFQANGGDSELHPNMVFDNFIVGGSNELALKGAQAIAGGCSNYSPLYIHGKFGLGKTHLLHSICHASKLPYQLLSADKFVKRYVRAVKERENGDFDGLFEGIEILLIDDIHMIAGKKSSETELGNIVGRLRDSGCRIVVASSLPLAEIENLNPCLASRLSGGLAAEILPMDNETTRNFILRKTGEWDMQIPADVLHYMAEDLPDDKRALEGSLKTLRARVQLLERPVTLEIIEPIWKGMRKTKRAVGHPTIRSIQDLVCKEFDITLTEMKSPRRHKRVVVPRQVAMFLCKRLTTRSLPEIASKFGGRDHTTVIHACKKIDLEIQTDASLAAVVESLGRALRA